MFRLLLLLGLTGALLVACSEEGYPLELGDDEYELEQMLLQEADIPLDMLGFGTQSFRNDEWALAFDSDEPELAQAQLDARKRITNALVVFGWQDPIEHLAQTRIISAQSTLYEDEDAAVDSLAGFCGLPIDAATAPDVVEFQVANIADGSLGLFLTEHDPDFGRIVDTIICFRTGRVVHAISQTGLAGSEDVGLAVRLAERMLERIEAVFESASS